MGTAAHWEEACLMHGLAWISDSAYIVCFSSSAYFPQSIWFKWLEIWVHAQNKQNLQKMINLKKNATDTKNTDTGRLCMLCLNFNIEKITIKIKRELFIKNNFIFIKKTHMAACWRSFWLVVGARNTHNVFQGKFNSPLLFIPSHTFSLQNC